MLRRCPEAAGGAPEAAVPKVVAGFFGGEGAEHTKGPEVGAPGCWAVRRTPEDEAEWCSGLLQARWWVEELQMMAEGAAEAMPAFGWCFG